VIGGARHSLGSEVSSSRPTPKWSRNGSGEGFRCGRTPVRRYKNVVKMTFAKGASLEDPSHLFNSCLEGNTRRAIDFHEGDKIDEKGVEGAHSRCRCIEHVLSRPAVAKESIAAGRASVSPFGEIARMPSDNLKPLWSGCDSWNLQQICCGLTSIKNFPFLKLADLHGIAFM
jgi:hypothetical protein